MALIKPAFQILSESAEVDINKSTTLAIKENTINKVFASVEESGEEMIVSAAMVPVVENAGDHLADLQYVSAFMELASVKSIAEALDLIAEANNLPEKSVGLHLDYEGYISTIQEAASKAKDKNAKEKILDKASKVADVVDNLKKKGYKVKKKKKDK